MKLLSIGRSIYGLLESIERRQLRRLLFISALVAVMEAAGATLVLTLLVRFASDGQEMLIDRMFSGLTYDEVTVLLSVTTVVYAAARMMVSLAESHLRLRRIQQCAASLSSRVLERYSRGSLVDHNAERSGDFLRTTWYASETLIRTALLGVFAVCAEVALMTGVIAVIAYVEPAAAIVTVAAAALLIFSASRLFSRYVTRWGEVAEDQASLCLQQVQELFGGFRDIKLANAESYFVDRYRKDRNLLARSYWRYQTMAQAPRFLVEGLLAGAIGVLITLFTLLEYSESGVAIMAVLGYVGLRVLPSANRMLAAVADISYGSAALELVGAVFHRRYEMVGPKRTPLDFTTLISITDVSVAYPGSEQPVITGVSLDIAKGDRIGLVGESGEGKTTLLNVVAGLISPDSGSVLVDGLDIGLVLPSWHEKVGVVSQNAFMADASIRFNVAFGYADDAIEDELVWWALEKAQLADFVRNLDGGLASSVGDRGVRLSGGQIQRVAIARALYKEPQVLLLDEPTAALDRLTEAKLAEALVDIGLEYTTFVISHRPAVLESCDQISRVAGGRLELVGSFEDLMKESSELSGVTPWS